MPPVSRRRKKHEEKLRKVQSRNLIAGLLLLLVAVGSVFLIRQLLVAPKPTVHVSINRINHSGPRSIPFSNDDSKGSCEIVKEAFEDFLDCETDDKIHDLDDQKSELKIVPSKIDPRDILVVYLNGHLTDAKSRPSVLDNSSSEEGTPADEEDNDDVYWICPDSDNVENKLSKLLAPISESNAKIKLVLLDAGRYSWSPTYPGRETNEFQSVLKKKLESNAWGLSDNFWIISSHSDGEISNVSTPLKGSLFSVAIKESLKELAEAGETDIKVTELFEKIENRTTTYSRNFEGRSLQNPVLMEAGEVLKSDSDGRVVSSDSATDEPLVLDWNDLPEKDDKAPAEPTPYEWTVFGSDPVSSDFLQSLFMAPHPAALPDESLYRVEMFLEHGHDPKAWEGPDKLKLEEYLTKREELVEKGKEQRDPTNFDIQTLRQKQQRTNDFRRAILELAILSRFRNQFRLFDDNAWKEVAEQKNSLDFIPLSDTHLKEFRKIPLIDRFPGQLEVFLANHNGLKNTVKNTVELHGGKKEKTLTPMQAELLGVLAHRYLPLIQGFAANQDPSDQPSSPDAKKNDNSDDLPKSFTLSLVPLDGTDRYDPDTVEDDSDPSSGIKAVAETGKQEFSEILAAVNDPDSDTSHRYRLAAKGSEFISAKPAVIPSIKWDPAEKSISISAITSDDQVPFFERKKIQLDLNTTVVSAVDLQIKQTGSKLPGLSFGFDEDFGDKLKLTKLDDAGQHRRTKAFDVHFRYAKPDEEMKGKRFDFEITALDRAAPDENPYSYRFSIQITSDATLRIATKRILANENGDRSVARLYRWGNPPSRANWEPLRLRTLANVKSPFEFELTSDTQNAKKFTARLFAIKQFPTQIDRTLLSSDRRDINQVRAFVRYLEDQSNIPGVPPLERPGSFELIGEDKIELPKTGNEKIQFKPPAKDPAATGDNEKNSGTIAIKHGLILALYSEDENGTSRNPTWYQMLFFDPQEPANAVNNKKELLKIKPDIASRFGPIDIDKLPKSLAPSVDEKQAAKLTVVSEAAFVENEHFVESLNLSEVLSGDNAEDGAELPLDSSPAMLMLEVLGLPNYMTFESDGTTISASGFRRQLAGIRIKENDEQDWKVYPSTWSFAYPDRPPGRPYEWLARPSNSIQNIYVRGAKKDESGELELYLPLKGDVLSPSRDDFSVTWKGGPTTLQYPNERKHLISITDNGFSSWSEIGSHSISISGISNKKIVIQRKSDDQILGQWQFITSSPNASPLNTSSQEFRPKLTAVPTTLEATKTQIRSTLITLDIRHIVPPVQTSAIQLTLNGGEPLAGKKLEKFLEQGNRKRERGLFEFSFADLRTAFGKKMLDQLEPNTLIVAEVIDFFGEPCPTELPLTIKEKKKEKPKPKPVTLEITFAGTDDAPVELMGFSSVQLNESSIPLNRPSAFKGSTIKVTTDVDTPSLKISGLFPGTYSLQVDADVKPPGQAQYIPKSAREAKVIVTEEGAKVTLSFK